MIQRLFIVGVLSALNACASTPGISPGPKFDESKPLALPCRAEPERLNDVWYVHILRNAEQNPNEAGRFASGAFVARVGVWATFAAEGQQFITVLVGSTEDRQRIDAGRVSTGHMVTGKKIVDASPSKCEAFQSPE
jgi:hypothetical protein